MTFETKRLILRPWEESDAPALYKYASDPDVGPSAGWAVHKDVEDSLNIIRTVLSAEGTFAVIVKENGGEAVGSIGFFQTDVNDLREIELGYWIGKSFWGRGYIPEAMDRLMEYLFEERGESRLWCAHFDFNERSRRVIEKCSFRYELSKVTEWPAVGTRHLTHYYSLCKAEWRSKKQK